MNNKKITKTKIITFISLRVLLACIIAYSIGKVIFNHDDQIDSQFLFITWQAILLLIVSFVPSIIEKKWKIEIPDIMELVYIFVFTLAILIGEIGGMYEKTYWWDAIVHGLSGGLITLFGFSLINVLNKKNYTKLNLTPLFIATFVFCFSISIGVLWEIFEFLADTISGSNMQRYFDDINQVDFVGQMALVDTMQDFMMNMIGALVMSVVGYFDLKNKNNKIEKLTISIDENNNNK